MYRTLSPRECLVLRFVAWGYTNQEIAGALTISVKTVEAHKFNGMRKLRTENRAALVRHAIASGWLLADADPRVSVVSRVGIEPTTT